MSLFNKADILIPKKNIELEKWSVVACDQYTSEPEYWQSVEKMVGDKPSALKIVFPEVYLDEGNGRIEKINAEMDKYLNEGIFEEYKDSIFYTERKQRDGRVRIGIIGAVDLEEYDFSKGSQSFIRATEGTVLERIPPRVKIRENASLELPHIMLLMDNPEKDIIKKPTDGEIVYDFELMENSGHLFGMRYSDKEAEDLVSQINERAKQARGNLFFAVGDGNHSLATAKTCWENLKKSLTEEEKKNHPSRFALVEIENIHDDALDFEPIHRIVFAEGKDIIKGLREYYKDTSEKPNGGQHIKCICKDKDTDLYIKNSDSQLAVGTLQNYLDTLGLKIDYIHGEDVARRLAKSGENTAFLLPKPEKSDLFTAVIKDGALPRKTFSMGEAYDKRFYLEAKKIKA